MQEHQSAPAQQTVGRARQQAGPNGAQRRQFTMHGRNWNVHLMMMPVEATQGAPGDFSSLMELFSGLGLPGIAAG